MKSITRDHNKKSYRLQRHRRVRARVVGTMERPRMSVFKSNQHIYVQIIDDASGRTIASASDMELKTKEKQALLLRGVAIGALIAERAMGKKITQVVFDRGGFRYHGVIKALAESARKGGLIF